MHEMPPQRAPAARTGSAAAPSAAYAGDLFSHLRSFLTLAQRVESAPRRAFEEAAATLHLDVSVLRRRMATLSAWLGAPLFEGRGASLRVARGGARAREIAARALLDLDALRAGLRGDPGRLSIGCTGTVTTDLLPSVVRDLMRRFPGIEIHLRRTGAERGEALLRRGELDVVIVRGDHPPKGLVARRIAFDRLWMVVRRDHPLARSKSKRPPDLRAVARGPLILFAEGSTTRARILERLGPLGATVQLEVDGRSAALSFATLGLGIAFLSQLPGQRVHTRELAALDVTAQFRKTAFWVLTRESASVSEAQRFLVEQLEARAKKGA
jgi:LysR family transcriptional regulator, carnitine catabolism transcriptional activator